MLAYSAFDADACAVDLSRVWKTVWGFLESNHSTTRKATAEALDLLSQCFNPSLIKAAIQESKEGITEPKSVVGSIIAQANKALDSLTFARSMPDLLAVIASLITNLRYTEDDARRKSTVAAEALLLPLIRKIGDLRTQKGFEHKEAADSALAVAMRVLGPKILLQVLPLNLEPADR